MNLKTIVLSVAALGFAGLANAQDTTTPQAEEPAAAAEQPAPTEAETPAPSDAATPAPTDAVATEPVAASAPALPGGLSAPPGGKGQIVFFRPAGQMGMALTFTVRENEAPLGRLGSARYFVHVAEPGIHEYEVGNNDTMRMEVEDGETYYVVQRVQMGIVAGRAVLAPSTADDFSAALPRMRLARPIEE